MRLALAIAALAALAAAVPAVAAAPARVQVAAEEFHFTLSRSSIRTGTAIVELANYGEDPHDLRMQRRGGTRVYAIGVVQPDDAVDLTAKLLPGTYTLWCSLADHRKRGMQATLVVKK